MTDEPDQDDTEETRQEQTANSTNSTDRESENSAEELIRSNLDTFVELAESDLPIAEDAEKAVAMTDGGEDL